MTIRTAYGSRPRTEASAVTARKSATAVLIDTERKWKMSRITDIAKTMKTWWNEDDDPFVHRALDEIIRIDQEQLPTIEPKRGEWIEIRGSWSINYTCSNCGKIVHETEYNYCPNCGAKMEGYYERLD